jgi:cytochrome c peroxidase
MQNHHLSLAASAVIVLAMTVLLAACGGGGGGTDTTPASTIAASPADTAAAATPEATPASPVATALQGLSVDLANLPNYAAPVLPAYYNAGVLAGDNTPASNRATDAAATLGRVLFYDRQLSVNNTISCASCHQQAQGFGDTRRFSLGFAGGATTAHAMRLGNVRYYAPGSMFWDKRAASLEAQATQPIQHPVEMGFDVSAGGLATLLAKLQALPYYPALFTAAFGDATVTQARVQRALAQFQRAMVAASSRWDTGYAANFNPALPDDGLGAPIAGFTEAEERGRQLFIQGRGQGGLACAACHVPPTFALAANSRSNGLDAGETTIFKSPSLKSVSRSGAFMHDGRFSSLEQVVEHYNSGVQDGPALDNRLRAGNAPRRLNLNEADKAALVAFLRTLDDLALAADPKFSSPFVQ